MVPPGDEFTHNEFTHRQIHSELCSTITQSMVPQRDRATLRRSRLRCLPTLGYTVSYKPLDGRAGSCSARQTRIAIDSDLPTNAKVATLVHELAHAHSIDYTNYSRAEAELIVESVASIVCDSAGLQTRSESVPYLAAWNPSHAAERIERLAAKIDEIARTIEHALLPHTPSASNEPEQTA